MIIYHHPDTILHKVPTGHPERPERIMTLHDMIDDRFPSLTREHAPLTDYDTLGLVHHSSYLESLFNACPEQGLQGIDGDTYLSPKSLEVAMRGVGAACASVDDVMTHKKPDSFCRDGHQVTMLNLIKLWDLFLFKCGDCSSLCTKTIWDRPCRSA